MAEYFTANDLRARLNKTACWIHEEAECIAKRIKVEGRIDKCRMNDLSIVVAMWQAAECYTPITSEEEDGVNNCLTEAEEESLFNNISAVTGLCFVPKGIEWIIETEDDDNQTSIVKDALGNPVLNAVGLPVYSANVPAQEAALTDLKAIVEAQKVLSEANNTGTYKKG